MIIVRRCAFALGILLLCLAVPLGLIGVALCRWREDHDDRAR